MSCLHQVIWDTEHHWATGPSSPFQWGVGRCQHSAQPATSGGSLIGGQVNPPHYKTSLTFKTTPKVLPNQEQMVNLTIVTKQC